MHSVPTDVLAALGAVFSRRRVRWYLFGAQAAILYGAARLTADIDVTVDLGGVETESLVEDLAGAGFALRVRDLDGFIRRTRVLPLAHVASSMPVDVVLAGPGLEEAFIQRRRYRVLSGVRIPIASPEDLVTMKLLAGRGKDDDDVIAIIAAQPKLDTRLIRKTLGQLERALDRGDLVAKLDDVINRAGRR